MKNRRVVHGLLAAGFAVLLLSCGSSRHVAPSRAEELTGFVLIIEEAADGRVSHAWKRASVTLSAGAGVVVLAPVVLVAG
jgi:hypothetical protein